MKDLKDSMAGRAPWRQRELQAEYERRKPLAWSAARAALIAPASPAEPSGYTVERHGKGWAIYRGRDKHHHGWNLGQLTECDDQLPAIIQAALNGAPAQVAGTREALTDQDLIALGLRLPSGLPPWGITSTRDDYLRAVRNVLAARPAGKEGASSAR